MQRSVMQAYAVMCAAGMLALVGASSARAQPGARNPGVQGGAGAETTATTTAPAASTPAAAAAEPVPLPSPAPEPIPGGAAACVLGSHDGIEFPDARTTAILVCEALQRAGAHVSTSPVPEVEAAARAAAYRVDIHRLGYVVVLQARFESPVGREVSSRSVQLNGIEEASVAAPRLAESLVNGTPLEKTAKVNSLFGTETRSYQKEPGEMLFSLGVLGFALPGGTWAGYGVWGRVYYEAPRYAVGIDLRVGGSTDGDGDASLVSLAVGGRFFFTETDISPFLGAGLGIIWLGQQHRNAGDATYPDGENVGFHGSGIAPLGEVGVEFLRLHKTRFDLLMRVDAPLFEIEGSGSKRYRVPIALMGSFSFN